MKGKKPLLLAVLVVALLAVALIVPAVASGKSANQPVNRVTGNYNSGDLNLPDSHAGFTVNVQQGSELTDIKGFELQKIMQRDPEGDFANAPVVRRATEFVLEGPWRSFWSYFGLADTYLDGYARFYGAGENPSCGWGNFFPDIFFPPTNLVGVDLSEANIADFVVSLNASFLPPPYTFDLWPHRYVIVDFDEPGRADLVQLYGYVPIDEGFGLWWPALLPDGNPDLAPVPAGNFQVHVGESADVPNPPVLP